MSSTTDPTSLPCRLRAAASVVATDQAAALLNAAAAAIERLEAERDAITRLCFHPHEDDQGQWFYRIGVDPADGLTFEDLGLDGCDFDTEVEAVAAVRRAAGLDVPGDPAADPADPGEGVE